MHIRFYVSRSGSSPVEQYLEDLPAKERAMIVEALDEIERHGLERAQVRARKMKGKLWEIKLSKHRIFYVVITGPELILLHAYKKQSQKAPHHEIAVAFARLKEVCHE